MGKQLQAPRPQMKAVLLKDGKRPPVDLSMVPRVFGETIAIGFRAGADTCDDIQEHLDRLAERAPGVALTVSDAVRSLIQRGAQGFRDNERKQPEKK